MISYTLYITSQSHFMTSLLSIYDITATALMTSYTLHRTSRPGFMTSRPLSLWHHRHYLCEYISTIFNIKQTVQRQYNPYIWNHNLHMCICEITHTVLIIKHTLYLWHGTYWTEKPWGLPSTGSQSWTQLSDWVCVHVFEFAFDSLIVCFETSFFQCK